MVARRLRHMGERALDMRPAWPAVTRRAVEGYKRSFDSQGPGWRPLGRNTRRDRVRKGYEPEGPILVASGKLKKRVMDPKVVEGHDFLTLIVDDPVMMYHQGGTKNMTSRPIHLRNKDGTFMAEAVAYVLLEAYYG